MTRIGWDDYFIGLAFAAAERATCPRLSVGCVLVKDNNVISTGYNGAPPGDPHCTDVGCDIRAGSCARTIHAEANAIARSKRRERSGSSIYITDFPCVNCAKLIATKGITQVIYARDYISKKRTLTDDPVLLKSLDDWEETVLGLFDYHGIILLQYASPA
jgi:dCMP deaminase